MNEIGNADDFEISDIFECNSPEGVVWLFEQISGTKIVISGDWGARAKDDHNTTMWIIVWSGTKSGALNVNYYGKYFLDPHLRGMWTALFENMLIENPEKKKIEIRLWFDNHDDYRALRETWVGSEEAFFQTNAGKIFRQFWYIHKVLIDDDKETFIFERKDEI